MSNTEIKYDETIISFQINATEEDQAVKISRTFSEIVFDSLAKVIKRLLSYLLKIQSDVHCKKGVRGTVAVDDSKCSH
jgi:hypothetical protein